MMLRRDNSTLVHENRMLNDTINQMQRDLDVVRRMSRTPTPDHEMHRLQSQLDVSRHENERLSA
jgi:hypothetical protein